MQWEEASLDTQKINCWLRLYLPYYKIITNLQKVSVNQLTCLNDDSGAAFAKTICR